jgi:hypothetical protein
MNEEAQNETAVFPGGRPAGDPGGHCRGKTSDCLNEMNILLIFDIPFPGLDGDM